MKIAQFIHQMNFGEVNNNQTYIGVDANISQQVENIIPRSVHVSFIGKKDGQKLSPNNSAETWPSGKREIQTIGQIIIFYKVKPGDLIIFEKRENDCNVYVECVDRDEVISVLRCANSDYYEILNEHALKQVPSPINVQCGDYKYELHIKDVGDLEKRKDRRDFGRRAYKITLNKKNFNEVISDMDDFNIFNVNGQCVIEKNIKNKIVEIEL